MKNIVILDDNEDIGVLLKEYIEVCGEDVQVQSFSSHHSFLENYNFSLDLDILFLDFHINTKVPEDLFKELNNKSHTIKKIYIMSGDHDVVIDNAEYDVDYLPKPFDFSKIPYIFS